MLFFRHTEGQTVLEEEILIEINWFLPEGAGAATVVVGADVVGAVGAPKLKPEAGAPNVLPVVA